MAGAEQAAARSLTVLSLSSGLLASSAKLNLFGGPSTTGVLSLHSSPPVCFIICDK
jgi:hypothetical protein